METRAAEHTVLAEALTLKGLEAERKWGIGGGGREEKN